MTILLLAYQIATPVSAAATATGSPIGDLVVAQGPMGIIVVMLLGALRTLWGQNEKLRAQVDMLQEARLNDGNVSRDKLLQMSDKVHATTDDLAKVADRFERTKP